MLTDEQLNFYDANGYILIDDFLSPAQCDEIIAIYEQENDGSYNQILNLDRRNGRVRALMTEPRLVDALEQIQGDTVVGLSSILFFSKPGQSRKTNIHQDNYAIKSPNGAYMTVGFHLDDADGSNGALVVYPGTHRYGDLDNIPSKNFDLDAEGKVVKVYNICNEIAEIPGDAKPLQLAYRKGSIVIFHCRLIHASTGNPHPTRWRRVLYMNYIREGEPFWPGWTQKRELIRLRPVGA